MERDDAEKKIADYSHAIRNALGGILGMCQLLELEDNSPKSEEYLSLMHGNIKSLLNMLNEMLEEQRTTTTPPTGLPDNK